MKATRCRYLRPEFGQVAIVDHRGGLGLRVDLLEHTFPIFRAADGSLAWSFVDTSFRPGANGEITAAKRLIGKEETTFFLTRETSD